MVSFGEFAQYPGKDEEVIYAAETFSVNQESGYRGGITTKRILFLKEERIHEVMGSALSTISWETSRKNILLLPSVLLILIGLVAINSPGFLLFFLGFAPLVFWYKRKEVKLVIYTTSIKLQVSGKKDQLEKLMKGITRYLVV